MGVKFDFFLPYFHLFAACLPIDFFQIEHLQVPFLRRFLVKKVNVSSYFPLIDIYLIPFRQQLIFRVQECRAHTKILHVNIEVNVEDLICKTVQGQDKPMSLNCCGAVCLIQKPFPLMRVINTEAALL
ncbi:hypothetical protein ACQRD6_01110 [Prevotella sp. SGI.027]|nr:hypothetical protein [Prevotellaceae bacterium]MDY3104773.1 hypothetical protein [Prevotella sp.]MDY5843708.1 hypothetical protein [Prevotella sp.]